MDKKLSELLGNKEKELLPCIRTIFEKEFDKKANNAYYIGRLIINGLFSLYTEQEVRDIVYTWRQINAPTKFSGHQFEDWVHKWYTKYSEEPLRCGAYVATHYCSMSQSKCKYYIPTATAPRKKDVVEKLLSKIEIILDKKEKRETRVRVRTKKPLLPCIKNMLNLDLNHLPQVSDGDSATLTIAFFVSNSMFQGGYTRDEITNIVTNWNNRLDTKKADQAQIIKTIDRAERRVEDGIPIGCSKIIDYNLCTPTKCKIARNKKIYKNVQEK